MSQKQFVANVEGFKVPGVCLVFEPPPNGDMERCARCGQFRGAHDDTGFRPPPSLVPVPTEDERRGGKRLAWNGRAKR
jgi:hypothetical protein